MGLFRVKTFVLNLYAKVSERIFSRVDENWLFTGSSNLQRKYDFGFLIAERVGIN